MSGPGRIVAICALALFASAMPVSAASAVEAPPSHAFFGSLEGFVEEPGHLPKPPPEGELEDACGVALDAAGDIYVSDYYHRVIDVFSPGFEYLTQIADPDPDGPCGLAVDASGNVYVNHWHRNVVRFSPSSFPPTAFTRYGPAELIDPAGSTGVAIDPVTGNLYVDDRTYVAEYEAPIEPEATPVAKIGAGGGLGSGYGVAVSSFPATAGLIYVADADDHAVEVYDPDQPAVPVQTIAGLGSPQQGFHSLADAGVAVDGSTGHVYVADNLQPGFARPAAVVDEFNAAGEYRGQLPRSFVDAEPTAIALGGGGGVYVTNGNSEEAVVDVFGPTLPAHRLEVVRSGSGAGTVISEPAGIDCGAACAAEFNSESEVVLRAAAAPGSTFVRWSGAGCTGGVVCSVVLGTDTVVTAEFVESPHFAQTHDYGALGSLAGGPAAAAVSRSFAASLEATQQGDLRVRVNGHLMPSRLPRAGLAPVRFALRSQIGSTDQSNPPRLLAISIAINRHGYLDSAGLPVCLLDQIQPSTSADALRACRGALVGEGAFSANVLFPQQAPFPSDGKVLAFNTSIHGRPAILAHVYGTEPAPISTTIPFAIHRRHGGQFGLTLTAALPQGVGEWGNVTGLRLTLGRIFSHHGERHSYLSADCPAPPGFPGAVFPLARTRFHFAGGRSLSTTTVRSCKVRATR